MQDLTTETTTNQATIYAPPVVVDLDADGELEVIVGTGLGFLYVLSGESQSEILVQKVCSLTMHIEFQGRLANFVVVFLWNWGQFKPAQ